MPNIRQLPSADFLRSILSYNADTGVLTWKSRPGASTSDRCFNAQFAGKPVGSRSKRHLMACVKSPEHGKQRYLAHRVIWKIVTGDEPPPLLDHRNGDGTDNRWVNLRAATDSQNLCNTPLSGRNTSGFKGVTYNKQIGRWVGAVVKDYESHFAGCFDTAEQANAAVMALREKLHEEFARHK